MNKLSNASSTSSVFLVAVVVAAVAVPVFEVGAVVAATPLDAISARGDLMNPPIYGGAIDGKIASYELIKNFSIRAVSGPTHDTQPIFTWDNVSMKECPHVAQPETFGYDWENW